MIISDLDQLNPTRIARSPLLLSRRWSAGLSRLTGEEKESTSETRVKMINIMKIMFGLGLAGIGSFSEQCQINSAQLSSFHIRIGRPFVVWRGRGVKMVGSLRSGGGCHEPCDFMPSSFRQVFVTTRNVCDLSCTRRWQERPVPLPFPHRLRSTPPAYL